MIASAIARRRARIWHIRECIGISQESRRCISISCLERSSSLLLDVNHRRRPVPDRLPALELHKHGMPLSLESRRHVASWLPEVVQDFSIWGGSGYLLKTLHMDGTIPYWACFALINFLLRTALIPVVVYRFAKVAPELQFIVTLFQNDLKKMRAENRSMLEKRYLFLQNLQTVRSVYKLHNINPLSVFLSPFLQIPFFWYMAVDLRKIVNGADPALAQELVDSSFWWLTDLTDPDPWYGLPIAAGAMLYFNVEVAMGRRSLSGPTTSKSDFAGWVKDGFQTLAVFMPCFASQSPAGIQIYLVSSFTWTLFQSAALRYDPIRLQLGLPPMGAAPTEAKYAEEFMEFKKLEQKAKEIRGDGPVLGRNVLAAGLEVSFPGTARPSTIQGSDLKQVEKEQAELAVLTAIDMAPLQMRVTPQTMLGGSPYVHGVSAPISQIEEQMAEVLKEQNMDEKANDAMKPLTEAASEELMEAANKGVMLAPSRPKTSPRSATLSTKRFKRNPKTGKKRRR